MTVAIDPKRLAAAGDALKPTQTALQSSALDLVKRMCALIEEA